MRIIRIATSCLLIFVLPLAARADFFQYTDQDGTVVIVDDESKIPKKFRKKARTTRADPVGASTTTSVRVNNNQVFVPVSISYRDRVADAWLLMDTGASSTVISTALASRLGIRPSSTELRQSRVADGRVVQAFRTRVDSITVGPKSKYNAEVFIIPSNGPDMGYDGLLGMNFLREFPHRLDINTQLIEWQQ